MKAYIIVSFILTILSAAVSAGLMANDDYPRKREYGIGFDTANLIFALAFAGWAAFLIFGQQPQ